MRYHEGTMLLGWSGGYNIPHQGMSTGGGGGGGGSVSIA